MNNEQRQFVGESYIKMHQSLIDSVKQAGGDETAFYYDEIKDITVSTLFNKLATNGIRFTSEMPEEDEELPYVLERDKDVSEKNGGLTRETQDEQDEMGRDNTTTVTRDVCYDHGEITSYGAYRCDKCGAKQPDRYPHCPGCGRRIER